MHKVGVALNNSTMKTQSIQTLKIRTCKCLSTSHIQTHTQESVQHAGVLNKTLHNATTEQVHYKALEGGTILLQRQIAFLP